MRGRANRDPRKHVISIFYHVAVAARAKVKAGDDAAVAEWYEMHEIWTWPLAFDHKNVLWDFCYEVYP